jgi:dihydroorotate dehydrogenase electron transfer subunit
MALEIDGIVLGNGRIKSLYYLLEIYCPPIAATIQPGQFIMLRISDTNDPFLRRPFSVYKSSSAGHREKKRRGQLSILYKNVGKGTRRMTGLIKGQKVNMIGPLGNGFSIPPLPSSANIILVGGGVGIVSLYPLAEALGGTQFSVFVGGKTRDDILCEEDFRKLNSNIFIATEDGSLGFKGTVIDLYSSQEKKFKSNRSHYIYSCGPVEMLKELATKVKFRGFICQASLEARMGCGFGACWGCVVKTIDPKVPYQRVCKEGPVFNLKDIAWE